MIALYSKIRCLLQWQYFPDLYQVIDGNVSRYCYYIVTAHHCPAKLQAAKYCN